MTDSDRKYMVQTLATLLMTYKPKPSLRDCLIVSRGLHQKFPSLGDESSEVCIWMDMCIFCFNVFGTFRVRGNGSYIHERKM